MNKHTKHYTKENIERVKKLFFRTKLYKKEDVINNTVSFIRKKTKLSEAIVDKIIDLEILKLNNAR